MKFTKISLAIALLPTVAFAQERVDAQEQFEFSARVMHSIKPCREVGYDTHIGFAMTLVEETENEAVATGLDPAEAEALSKAASQSEARSLSSISRRFDQKMVRARSMKQVERYFQEYQDEWVENCASLRNDTRSSHIFIPNGQPLLTFSQFMMKEGYRLK